jgi:hypothetical protein
LRIDWHAKICLALLVFACVACGLAPTNSGKLPLGAIDTPSGDAIVKGVSFAIGWALCEDGVDRVAIYLDRTYLQDAVLKGRREDVVKVFPQFSGVADVRWITELHTESLPIGRHEISARVISRRGATRDLAPHIVNIEH